MLRILENVGNSYFLILASIFILMISFEIIKIIRAKQRIKNKKQKLKIKVFNNRVILKPIQSKNSCYWPKIKDYTTAA